MTSEASEPVRSAPLEDSPDQPIVATWPAGSPRLQIRCFGRFEVFHDGVPVKHWRRLAARTLLKYLIVQRRPIHRDVLLDLLWPELPATSALNGLRVTLHALRRALGASDTAGSAADELVLSTGHTYFLNPSAQLWVDADAFSAHFAAGLRFERQARVDDAGREYAAAEALYRDDFLIEDLYDDWTVLRREELRDEYLLLLTKLAQYCLTRRDAEGCIVRCHKLLAKEPCSEDAYQRLMRAYAQLGQYRRAAHWFEVCERTLRQELDVAPSDEMRRLYRGLTSAVPHGDIR